MHCLGTLYMGVVTEQPWVLGDGGAASSLGFQTLRSSRIDQQTPVGCSSGPCPLLLGQGVLSTP